MLPMNVIIKKWDGREGKEQEERGREGQRGWSWDEDRRKRSREWEEERGGRGKREYLSRSLMLMKSLYETLCPFHLFRGRGKGLLDDWDLVRMDDLLPCKPHPLSFL